MKIFECGNCEQPLYFENQSCGNCGHLIGYAPEEFKLKTFDQKRDSLTSDRDHTEFKFCKNHQYGVCNWLIKGENADGFCHACKLNRMIPDLSDHENFNKWQRLEVSKHRLVYQLDRLGLVLHSKMDDVNGLCFDFVAKHGNQVNKMTGHADGVITILLSEADPVQREQMRKQLSEPYRTVIGHFRHEVGHYFWDRLVANDFEKLKNFRNLFGDDRKDYQQSLNDYYQGNTAMNWQESFISEYATSHPWEDWAETWAHYLHIMDMAETAYYFGFSVDPKVQEKSVKGSFGFDPYEEQDFQKIFNSWAPLSFAINSLNRSMGTPDAYPFVVSPLVIEKMKFIHSLLYYK